MASRDFVAANFSNGALTPNLVKQLKQQKMLRATYTGTYTGAAGTVQASMDGNSYVTLIGQREDTGAAFVNTGTNISAAQFSVLYNVGGWQYVQFVPSAVASGTLGVSLDEGASFTLPIGVTPISLAAVGTTITSSSANALAVGANGTTNPAFNVDASAGSAATGLNIAAAAAAGGLALSVLSSGAAENLTINAKGTGTITLASVSTGVVGVNSSLTVTTTSANGLAVGANGTTNPVFQVAANTGSVATGIKVTGAAAAGGVAIQAISSNATEAITIDAKAGAAITLAGAAAAATGVNVGTATSAANCVLTVTSSNANAFTVGANGATNPVLKINANTGSVATGISITGAAAAAGVALAAISSGTDETITINAKGAGLVNIASASTGILVLNRGVLKAPVIGLTKTDFNSQNAAPTIAQWLGGYITHNTQTAGGTLTTPTGATISGGISGVAVGDSFFVNYNNRGNQTATLTAGDGNVTLRGTVAIPTLKSAVFLFINTGANTWDVCSTLSA